MVPTQHTVFLGDSRTMAELEDSSVHLVVTSPPYWTLKDYPHAEGQLGRISDFKEFIDQLDKVWHQCFRVLVKGGRLCVVVGDVCLARRKHGRHRVIPLHAEIQVRCTAMGFDNLAPIIWYKIANVQTEMSRPTSFLGKPFEPNAIIKNDIEFILMFRKPGEYRHPTDEQRRASKLSKQEFDEYFRQVWDTRGQSTRNHPAPFPLQIATRLVRMFSFVGDTVLDPFLGTGTTAEAALLAERNSVGYEIEPRYINLIRDRLAQSRLDKVAAVTFVDHTQPKEGTRPIAPTGLAAS